MLVSGVPLNIQIDDCSVIEAYMSGSRNYQQRQISRSHVSWSVTQLTAR